ncbi:NADPH-dependent F420 reductase [Enterobacter cloacae complex sp. P40RS]|uniref:NADPH-dependent F420 reductase n=1 Tax=Enterobacter pasteurii TaxID=3029761 RepID=A0ABR9QBJ7_9ENTR|nr:MULTISPECIES: NADPH-dependent F420 reductase [Enterobacter cloacae complex]MBE4856200.1 NADPH-dependent F420 reductase [Enterobacter pasteurii]MBE4864356.1 NADPH-dependent F420 reductase [Enterobacter cloacae complex sp. P40C2]MBE4878760.1 NADPH-dependent F420 reductase [Enterobacter cloacae complex sp. P40C]HAS1783971.1 NADP oxidoreductase [Enterobacter pasteurii]
MKTTTVGIIGAGAIGQAFAGQLVNAGINVILSNSRGPESLADVVERLGRGARAGTVRQAAEADIVFVSTNWDKTEAALSGISWEGRILIDATNPVLLPGYRLAELGGKNSSQVVTRWAPGARVVKAFNTLLAGVLAQDPAQAGGRRVVFISGDHADAKAEVIALAGQLGFATIDLGSLEVGGTLQQFPGGPLPAVNLVQLA